jgi:hypothetical protein
MRISIEKIYRIDDAGNADIERSWIIVNPNNKDIDLTNHVFYVDESVNTLGNLKAFDSDGTLEYLQEEKGSDIEIVVTPRISKLASHQNYKMTLQYHFPNFVHKLGDIWFFTDLYGVYEPPSAYIPKKTDIMIQVYLPKLGKRLWEKPYHESSPPAIDLSKRDTKSYENSVLEWKCSLSSQQNYQIRLIYGIRTNTRLANFITAVPSLIVGGLIKLFFDWVTKGVI